jgi:hypothetical protein
LGYCPSLEPGRLAAVELDWTGEYAEESVVGLEE